MSSWYYSANHYICVSLTTQLIRIMKKFIFFAMLTALAYFVPEPPQAVAQVRVYANSTFTPDTTRGDSTKNFYLGRFADGSSFSVQVNTTKISGTAGGEVYLEGSSDGENPHQWLSIAGDSATLGDASNKHHLNVSSTTYRFYRLTYDPESTDTSQLRVWFDNGR